MCSADELERIDIYADRRETQARGAREPLFQFVENMVGKQHESLILRPSGRGHRHVSREVKSRINSATVAGFSIGRKCPASGTMTAEPETSWDNRISTRSSS